MLVGSGGLATDLAGSGWKHCWIAIATVLHPMMDAVGFGHRATTVSACRAQCVCEMLPRRFLNFCLGHKRVLTRDAVERLGDKLNAT